MLTKICDDVWIDLSKIEYIIPHSEESDKYIVKIGHDSLDIPQSTYQELEKHIGAK